MPRNFYPDTDQTGLKPVSTRCYDTVIMFDGPGICKRDKGHPVDAASPVNGLGQFHQEEYEGWVWNDKGMIG